MSGVSKVQTLISRISRVIRQSASVLLLLAGAAALYVFISVGFWSVVGPILGVVIGAVVAIGGTLVGVVRGRNASRASTPHQPLDGRVPIVLASLYVVSIILLFRVHTYQRPTLMYVLFGGYTGIIGYQIARGEAKHRIVPQILVLAFFTYWSSQFLFPAGMYALDTQNGYIPALNGMFETGRVPGYYLSRYAGHLAYVAQFALVGGISAQLAYYLLATLVLCGTVLLIGMLDRALSALVPRVALYGALVFSIMSWMIGRGMHPNKLNFFYPLILLLGIAAFKLYETDALAPSKPWVWLVIGFTVSPAIVFGHRYSAGAALFFLLAFGVFVGLSHTVLKREYSHVPQGSVIPFVFIYVLQVIGNPLHQGALLERITDTLLSVFVQSDSALASAGGGITLGGPGRYSELPLNVLLVSTSAQTLLFAFAVIGGVMVFKRSEWEFDYVLFWIGCISVLLVVSLLWNSADTAPQRFYSLLGLFGFNICAGVFLCRVDQQRVFGRVRSAVDIGPSLAAVFLAFLAVTSLASPIADRTTSPVNDEIPHVRQFETNQLNAGQGWQIQYAPEGSHAVIPPSSTLPLVRTGPNSGVVNTRGIARGTLYSYSELSMRTGVIAGDGQSLGGRSLAFVGLPPVPQDATVYTNGETTSFVKQSFRNQGTNQ